MPNLLWRITATDGTFQAGQTNLFDFNDKDLTAKEKQVNEVLLPNITQLSRYAAVSSNKVGSDGYTPWFQNSSGTWIQETTNAKFLVDSTKDCWCVIVPNTNNVIRVYLCKSAAEKDQIPNYSEVPSIEFRIASDITKANYNSWRKWTSTEPGLSNNGVLLAPVCIPLTTDHTVTKFLQAKPEGEKIRLSVQYYFYNAATSDVDQGSLPVVAQYLRKGNYIIYDLDERVTILESKVSDLEAAVKSNTDAIKALQTKIVDIGAAGSLYFVSR